MENAMMATEHRRQAAGKATVETQLFQRRRELRGRHDTVAGVFPIRVSIQVRAAQARFVVHVVLLLERAACFPEVVEPCQEGDPPGRLVFSHAHPVRQLVTDGGRQARRPHCAGNGRNVDHVADERVEIAGRPARVSPKLRRKGSGFSAQHGLLR
jgi:hypothetical protein